MKSSSAWEEEEVEVENDDADDEEEEDWLGRIGMSIGWLASWFSFDHYEALHLHQAYRLVFISSAWFRPPVVLTTPPWFSCDLTTGWAGTGRQLTPSGGWRRAQNLKAATLTRVGSPSRSPCPSSSSPVQLSSLHLLLLFSHIKC